MPIITVQHKDTRATDDASDVASTSPSSFSQRWTSTIQTYLHAPILSGLHRITNFTARRPKTVIASVVTISILTFVLGLVTNFSMDVDEDR